MPKFDPIVVALDNASAASIGVANKVDALFGDRPPVLAAIRLAHKRGVSARRIATILTDELPGDQSISYGAVKNWLDKQKSRGEAD